MSQRNANVTFPHNRTINHKGVKAVVSGHNGTYDLLGDHAVRVNGKVVGTFRLTDNPNAVGFSYYEIVTVGGRYCGGRLNSCVRGVTEEIIEQALSRGLVTPNA